MNEETRSKTQKKIDSIIGSFDDFVRMILTNADNLNSLLSLNRSTFIDSLISDAGYDLFDKKLKEFKSYKSEQETSINNISINVIDTEMTIEKLNNDIDYNVDLVETQEKELLMINDNLNNNSIKRDDLFKKLHKIDSEIVELNIDELNGRLNDYKEAIIENQNKQSKNESFMSNLIQEFDEENLKVLYKEIEKINGINLDIKLNISDVHISISNENQQIEKIDEKINQLKKSEIFKKEIEINNINEKISNQEIFYQKTIDKKILEIDKEIGNLNKDLEINNTKLSHIKENGINKKKEIKKIDKEIKELEQSKMCPTCLRDWDDSDKQEHINHSVIKFNEKIESLNLEIDELMLKVKPLQELNSKLKIDLIEKEEKKSDLEDGIINGFDDLEENKEDFLTKKDLFEDEIIIQNNIIKEIKDNNYDNVDKLKQNILKGLSLKEQSLKEIQKLQLQNTNSNQEIKDNLLAIEKIDKKVLILEKEKEEVKNYNLFLNENDKLRLEVDKYKLTIEKFNEKFKRYNEHVNYINDNNLNESKISEIDNKIDKSEFNKKLIIDKITNIKTESTFILRQITEYKEMIELFKKQEKQKELWKEYQSLVHRDGLPSFLLKKSIYLINNKLSEMLSVVDFDVYFDDELNLQMYMKNSPRITQKAIESSGKERSFIAVALKLALRSINNKSKINIILLDEVMGKLVNESVPEFILMLGKMKEEVEKVIIIEHNHPVQPDYIINVKKNVDGVSTFTVN